MQVLQWLTKFVMTSLMKLIEVSENKDAEKSEEEELLEATEKGNLVEAKAGEILIEVRPQYCEFSDKELALKLTKHVGFRLLCLPWVANTGRHFYTAGFKTTEESYEQFKSQRNGKVARWILQSEFFKKTELGSFSLPIHITGRFFMQTI